MGSNIYKQCYNLVRLAPSSSPANLSLKLPRVPLNHAQQCNEFAPGPATPQQGPGPIRVLRHCHETLEYLGLILLTLRVRLVLPQLLPQVQ